MAKVEIKSVAGSVLYTAEVDDSIPSGLRLRAALEKAVSDWENLCDAKLANGLTLVGERPIMTLGPIGSRSDMFTGYVTNQGLRVRAGCFFGTPDEFTSALETEHGTNAFAREYLQALELMKLHADLYKVE